MNQDYIRSQYFYSRFPVLIGTKINIELNLYTSLAQSQYKEFTIFSRLPIGQEHALVLGEAFQIKKRIWDFLKWVEI